MSSNIPLILPEGGSSGGGTSGFVIILVIVAIVILVVIAIILWITRNQSVTVDNSGGGGTSVQCTTAADCQTGQSCVSGTCVTSSGQCVLNTDCDTGQLCQNGICVNGNTCVVNQDCNTGERCENGACVPDVECTSNAQCSGSEVCINATCQIPPECTFNSDCPGSELCVSGTCTPQSSCFGNEDCFQPQICSNGVCIDPIACTVNADCPVDQICQATQCAYCPLPAPPAISSVLDLQSIDPTLRVSWSAVAGATSYTAYIGNSPTFNRATSLQSINTTNLTVDFSGLTAGQQYTVFVSTTDVCGEGMNSNRVSGTPTCAPITQAPILTGFSAPPNAQITWSNVVPNATQYIIRVGTTSDVNNSSIGQTIGNPAALSQFFNDSFLTGPTYFAIAQPVNSCTSGPQSNVVQMV